MQSNGTVVNRTFQAQYTATLQKQGDQGWVSETIYAKGVNVLGQHEYSNVRYQLGSAAGQPSGGMTATGAVSVGGIGGGPTGGLGSSGAPTPMSAVGAPAEVPAIGGPGNLGSPSPMSAAGTPAMGSPATSIGQPTAEVPFGNTGTGIGLPPPIASPVGGAVGTTIPTPYDPGANSNTGYGNLPPPPPPVLSNFAADTNYKFKVEAKLYELVNGSWVPAKDKSNRAIIQIEEVSFRTGAIELVRASSAPKSQSGLPAMGSLR